MRVWMIASEYPPAKVFGLGRAVHDLSRAQAAQGDEVHVFTNSIGGRDQDTVSGGVHVHRINFPSPPQPPDPTSCVIQFNLCLLERLHQLLPQLAVPDLVHAHDWIVGLAAQSLARRLQVPLVTTIHDTAMGKHFGRLDRSQQYVAFTERWLVGESTRTIACSEFVKSELVQHYGGDSGCVDVIPCGVDPALLEVPVNLPAFRSVFAHPEERLVCYVGRLDQEKGIDVLLHAFAQLSGHLPGLRLVLVGEGQRQAELQQLVGELGMTGQVTFLGYVAFPALAAIYRAAEVVVVPSLYEPFGLVALEAMAAGRPVVAAEAGGLTEIVTEGATGLCVPPGDAGALAAALERVLSDGALAGRLARQGREHAVSGYSWSRVAELTRDCYRRALAKRQETAEG